MLIRLENKIQQTIMPPSNQSIDIVSDSSYSSKETGGIVLYKNRDKSHAPRKSFPRKLYEMLKEAETNGLSHIISWQPHGMAFVVHKPQEFAKTIMPQVFRQTKYSSFQRQLNLYGFQRLYRGPDKGGYYHYSFIRGEETMLDSISRVRVKGTGVRQPTDVRLEPNFYALPYSNTVATTATTDVVPPIPDSTVGSNTSTTGNLKTTTDTPVPIKPQTAQAPTPSNKAFQETASHSPTVVSPTDDVIGYDPLELEQICSDLNMDEMDPSPEDDLGWAELVISIFKDDNDAPAITEPTSSPPPQVQMQVPHHHMIEESPSPKQDRRRSSMSIGSFDCTPLDFQAKPIYEFADTMVSYQAFLAGPNYETKHHHHVPHQITQKARAA